MRLLLRVEGLNNRKRQVDRIDFDYDGTHFLLWHLNVLLSIQLYSYVDLFNRSSLQVLLVIIVTIHIYFPYFAEYFAPLYLHHDASITDRTKIKWTNQWAMHSNINRIKYKPSWNNISLKLIVNCTTLKVNPRICKVISNFFVTLIFILCHRCSKSRSTYISKAGRFNYNLSKFINVLIFTRIHWYTDIHVQNRIDFIFIFSLLLVLPKRKYAIYKKELLVLVFYTPYIFAILLKWGGTIASVNSLSRSVWESRREIHLDGCKTLTVSLTVKKGIKDGKTHGLKGSFVY